MGDFERNKNNAGRFLAVLMAVAVLAALFAGCRKEENGDQPTVPSTQGETEAAVDTEPTVPEEDAGIVLHSIEEQGNVMVVTTSYCVVKYPYAFSDLIQVETLNSEDQAMLEFSALINETGYPMYTITFGGSEGILLGSMTVGEDQELVQVYAELAETAGELDESSKATFYAAQETFNDVIASLSENENFTPAE